MIPLTDIGVDINLMLILIHNCYAYLQSLEEQFSLSDYDAIQYYTFCFKDCKDAHLKMIVDSDSEYCIIALDPAEAKVN